MPVIVVSQLSMDGARPVDKRPRLSDLKEPEGLEHEADVVLLLYRADQLYGWKARSPAPQRYLWLSLCTGSKSGKP
jgi:replicative DNA helicase